MGEEVESISSKRSTLTPNTQTNDNSDSETAVIPGISKDLLDAYELDPSDFTLLAAMADQAQENGEEAVSEALRWAWEKRRSPEQKLSGGDGGWLRYGVAFSTEGANRELPPSLYDAYDRGNGQGKWWKEIDKYSFVEMLHRLVRAWKAATRGQRLDAWDWGASEVKCVSDVRPMTKEEID